ncbi:multicopper oxidase domain-containing protein [Tropicibacter sp. R16_0]|uniref:multicopper oxidase domain-containing protein n=1 Tax=Tropicibacter sp. R16_0 TaxID=2821102 RepID=UPI001AD9747C|nr:multicopper oxidase domain-containing protein [Tropicibacter sp. R16_0]MBO9453432.1 multicopper oxidase domain-containing protein [Tropicibacter sp. R16_0]
MTATQFMRAAATCFVVGITGTTSALADVYDITVDRIRIDAGTFKKKGIGYNGSQTPKVLRFKEGEEVTIRVKNNLRQSTSIHWHGLILPYDQDGVPGISFAGIKPGETFTYQFPIEQAGTYWFHSHSGFQEPDGAYGAIVIEPKGGEKIRADRDYVVQLTDTHPHQGQRIMRNLKMSADYYNRTQRTVADLVRDSRADGFKQAMEERKMWGRMRMMRTDVEDVQGFAAMINGATTSQNWTGLFKPGEKVRLRLVNSSAMTYFDVRIPGLKMTVVQADGNDVKPVVVDELRIAVAETYDVIVQPRKAQAYSIFAESMGRSAVVRGTLAPADGMVGPMYQRRMPPLLTMADMSGMMGGMHMEGHVMQADHSAMDMTPAAPAKKMKPGEMDHSQMDHGAMDHGQMSGDQMDHAAMGHGQMGNDQIDHAAMGHGEPSKTSAKPAHAGHGQAPDAMSGMSHAQMGHGAGKGASAPFFADGSGLIPEAANGGKFLSYQDLSAAKPLYPDRPATREIELRLTGNMERYIWSINGKKLSEAEPLVLYYGERVRFKFVNETMMAHPMHLHGMWSILDTGKGRKDPIKHTINVNPGTTVYTETEVDVTGQWAFHCHLSYHADAGMFRKVVIKGAPA